MVDTSTIHALVSRARRRLRLQAALETATTASILAFAAALGVVYGVRQGTLSQGTGLALLVSCAGIVLVAALIGSMRRIPAHIVATRIDRASNLSDRLSSAYAFEEELRATPNGQTDEQTAALMHAAIRDAVACAPRANIKAATPFARPRDSRAALMFGLVSALVAGLYWPDTGVAGPAQGPDQAQRLDPGLQKQADRFAEEDIDYARDLLEDLRRVARDEKEPHLDQFVKEVEELLAKAELGELTREELIEELAKAEERYMQGADEDMEKTMAELSETGRELEENKLTRELGQALQKGDLEKAREEMEKLAQKLEQGELDEKQKQELAKALEKAADRFEKKQKEREQKADKDIAEQKNEIRKLEKKRDESKDEDEKRKLTRKLDDKKRELKELEREKEKEEKSAQQRNLKSLHRNMKQASQQMKQDGQESQRMASQSMRKAAEDTGQVDADQRKVTTQKKVASQMNDLKEAMRRARKNGQNGQQDLFGKNRKNQDFRRRARGQQGSRTAWRPGQQGGQQQGGQQGQQGQGQQPGGQGQQPGGQSYGDEHDPYLMGDPTAKSGNTRDESISGVHGRGPSRRETILAAAQKGFASRSYKQVYAEYKAIVEEVIRAEKVPSGYKYYVKRYFQKIKPHSMD